MTTTSVFDKALSIFRRALNSLLNIGAEHSDEEETHVIRIVNLMASVAVPLTLINSLFYVNDIGVSPLVVYSTHIPLAMLYANTLILNYLKYNQQAKVWIFGVFLADITFSSTLLFGVSSYVQWHLILTIPIAFLVWSNKQYLVRYSILAITVGIFIFIMRYDYLTFAQLSAEEQRGMGISVFINVSIIVGLVSYLFARDGENYRKELHFLAKYDALTGLLSRREFQTRINNKLTDLEENQSCALILLDVDDFKEINDKYGHAAGDQALIHLASILNRTPLPNAGRIGGDEFCMFLENSDRSFVESFVIDLLKELKGKPFYFNGEPINLSVSIGITFETKRRSSDRLFAAADNAMYQTKRQGKGSYHFNVDSD